MEKLDTSRKFLEELAVAKMPFGKYKDRFLIELPEPYLVWFSRQGFPKGKLGQQLEAMLEIKTNGLERIIYEIRKMIKK
ncbi:DUF3820 family protein [Avrilella dinanensis]|uniref:DUF3820 family protein n=1 Tax=Avrilella dinanensis TaxID=2008672 RepID=UPI002409DB5F|nr:DUF3820 family protein [Avrilella dinanensis]